jgi:hypothetical protein
MQCILRTRASFKHLFGSLATIIGCEIREAIDPTPPHLFVRVIALVISSSVPKKQKRNKKANQNGAERTFEGTSRAFSATDQRCPASGAHRINRIRLLLEFVSVVHNSFGSICVASSNSFSIFVWSIGSEHVRSSIESGI